MTSKRVHTIRSAESDWQRHLIFLSEAYGEDEENDFVRDVQRMVHEVLDESFSHVAPLLAVEAIWIPSRRSGVPRVPRPPMRPQTAFGLFRDSSAPLRLVEPGPRSYRLAKKICHETLSRTLCSDSVLILLANDPYYGGLGDDIIIVTNSKSSGVLALRHELGHALGDVGEEYDAGIDYSGANFATSPMPCPKNYKPRIEYLFDGVERTIYDCVQWLGADNKNLQPKNASLALAEWPWQRPPFLRTFHTPQANHKWHTTLELSVAGGLGLTASIVPAEQKAHIDLPLIFKSSSSYDNPLDRCFATAQIVLNPGTTYTLRLDEDVFLRKHSIVYQNFSWSPQKLLCHVQLHLEQLQHQQNINIENTRLGVYPIFDLHRKLVGYRPTRCTCLMRDVTAGHFCQCCRDLILRRLLASANPLDQLQIIQNTRVDTQLTPLVRAGLVRLKWFRHDESGLSREDTSKRNLSVLTEFGCWTLIARFTSPHLLTHRPNVLEARSSFFFGKGNSRCFFGSNDMQPTHRINWRYSSSIYDSEEDKNNDVTSSSSALFSYFNILSMVIFFFLLVPLIYFLLVGFFCHKNRRRQRSPSSCFRNIIMRYGWWRRRDSQHHSSSCSDNSSCRTNIYGGTAATFSSSPSRSLKNNLIRSKVI
uniref:Uncharacterized protein n=1 Tax=Aureoumbra lagunensis TaxID=44058 RepID=A0A7S3K1J4_9STRA